MTPRRWDQVGGFSLAVAVFGVAFGIGSLVIHDNPKPAATPTPVPACVVAQAKTATAWKTVAAGEAKVNALLATHHLHSAVAVQHQVNRYRRHHLTSGDCP